MFLYIKLALIIPRILTTWKETVVYLLIKQFSYNQQTLSKYWDTMFSQTCNTTEDSHIRRAHVNQTTDQTEAMSNKNYWK